jgi:predicted NAD/FAD-dependent oxidoreductase
MNACSSSPRVAVIGAGIAGAACAHGLRSAGAEVTLFEKSRGPGGRMSTRRATWLDADGVERTVEFDHGAQLFGARHPRFRALLARAQTAGAVTPWTARVHAAWPAPGPRARFVAGAQMTALVRHLVGDAELRLQTAVQRLQRSAQGWHLVDAEGRTHGPFDQVVLAMPPAQAALLLAGHRDDWADALQAVPMEPNWTLMAVTDEVEWPWDAVEPGRGPLAWVARNDRKPGRSAPAGCAVWVAQASAAWSAAHLEQDAHEVSAQLLAALRALLPARAAPRVHYSAVHRWRYAQPAAGALDPALCWFDARLGLGVCGDYMAGGNVEAAWRSGDELGDTMTAARDAAEAELEGTGASPAAAVAPKAPGSAARTRGKAEQPDTAAA